MSRGNLYHPLLRPSRRLHQHFDRAMCRWNLKHVGFPSFARPGDAAFSHTSDNGYSGVDVKSFTGGVDSLRFVNASGLQSPPYGTPSVPAPWEKLRCDGNSLVIGVFGEQDACVSSVGIICSPGDFGPTETSTKMLRMQRNPKHAQRIPGGPTIFNTADNEVTVSVNSLPKKRISTSVTGLSKLRRVTTPAVLSRVDAAPSAAADASLLLPGSLADKAAAPEKAMYLVEGPASQDVTGATRNVNANTTTVDSTRQSMSPLDPLQPL